MEIENGGREAFLDFMLKYKSDLDLTIMPGGQGEQREKDKLRSAPAPIRFILDLYENGVEQYDEGGGRSYSETEFNNWMTEDIRIPKHLLLELFHMYCKQARIRVVHMDMNALFSELGSSGYYANIKKSKDDKYSARVVEIGRKRELVIKCREDYLEDVL